MYLMYADETGNTGFDLDNTQQRIFTLAGIMIESHKWNDLNNEINLKKAEFFPSLANNEIHTNDIFQGAKNEKKGFNFRINSMEENLRILERLIDLIVEFELPIYSVFIDKPNFKKYTSKKGIRVDPYLYAISFLSVEYNHFLIKKRKNGMILVDENNGVISQVEKVHKLLVDENYVSDSNQIIENILFLESKKNNFIQLADICNFYINKYHSITRYNCMKNEIKKEHCLTMYKKIKHLIVECRNPNILEEINNINKRAIGS